MIRFKAVFLIFIFFILLSCAAKKKAAELETQPAWVQYKPQIEGYYTGVGSAKKIGTPKEYIAKAKNDALADLVGEVSVQISATSVLHTIETQYGNTDFFDQRIETISNDYVEGFEPVDNYDTEGSYWVYYRIDKKTYSEAKAKRKSEAIARARAEYVSGKAAEQASNPIEAITFYLQGLSSISEYLAEETLSDLGGQKADLGNSLYTALNRTLASLSIKAMRTEVFVKRGEEPKQPIQFKVLYNGVAIKGIPVVFRYSGGYLNDNSSHTNALGQVVADLKQIHSKNEYEKVFASIDLDEIANIASNDLFIRAMLTEREPETATIQIHISLPKLILVIKEDFCQTNDCERIMQSFEKNVVQSGYLIGAPEDADYSCKLQLRSVNGETAGNLTSVFIEGRISLVNREDKTMWSKSINKLEGVGANPKEAFEEAFSDLTKGLNLIYFQQALEAIE